MDVDEAGHHRSVQPPTEPSPAVAPPAWRAGASGVVAVGLALGSTELLGSLIDGASSAVSSIGAIVVDLTPPAVEDAAISVFGTNDKAALALGTVLIALAIGWWVGRRAQAGWTAAIGPFSLFGLLGVLAVAVDPLADTFVSALIVVVGVFLGLFALYRLLDLATPVPVPAASDPSPAGHASRRRFLTGLTAVAVTGLVAGAAGRIRLTGRAGGAATSDLVLPEPVRGAPSPGPAQQLSAAGLTPVVVPNDEFYRIDTALIVPRVEAADWSLRIHGMVGRELTFTLDELYARDQVERYVTIACVSNEVGDDLVGNAAWQGIPLATLLEEAGVSPGADQVVGRSVDGWTAGFPTELVFDGREPLVALGMNGVPLPAEHGYPARLIVPGLYGYVSATKWLTEVELTTWDDFDAYWVPRGWAKEGPIKLQSRIDVPRQGAEVPAGDVVVAGVAWAGLAGISAVEVAVDDRPWLPAELSDPLSDSAWVQWRLTVPLAPGRHRLEVRATDAGGVVQTDELAPPRPDGATGHHNVIVRAT